jgi:peptide/nickel transport system permease protein
VANVKPSESDPPDGDRAADLVADGGETAAQDLDIDIFTRTADVPAPSRRDRIFRFIDTYVYAPLSIIANDVRGLVGLAILVFFVLMGIFGVMVVPKPTVMEGPIFAVPMEFMEYPLGTDNMGRPLHKMLVHATPAMLKMVLAGALFSITVGTFVGTAAGYKGGTLDQILMSVTDIVLTIPGLVLVIVLSSFYPPTDPYLVGLILAIDSWPGLARTTRSQVLSIREEAFTEASRVMGLSQLYILWKDVITNLMPYVSINFANSARRIIFSSVALYFLGILPFTTLNWGVIMNEAYKAGDISNPEVYHWLYVPMMAIILFTLGFVLFAQSLDRVFNVRLRARHAKTIESDDHQAPTQTQE